MVISVLCNPKCVFKTGIDLIRSAHTHSVRKLYAVHSKTLEASIIWCVTGKRQFNSNLHYVNTSM